MKEKLLCHAIIGRSGGKELVKKVKIICEFINPLLQFSTESICFTVCKVVTYFGINNHILVVFEIKDSNKIFYSFNTE